MLSEKSFFKLLKSWLIPVVVFTILSGLVYLAVQQNYRQGANDPQIQLAEDAADKITMGQEPGSNPTEKVDIAKSLAPFLMTFDRMGNLITSDAVLNDNPPIIPSGVFDSVKQKGESRFTWQPQSGVRIAAVMVYVNGKNQMFVLAGRSLREVERRVDQLTLTVGLVWLSGIFVISIFAIFLRSNIFKKFT